MRILHTSDWHLGISTGPASRVEEQSWFLDWLIEILETKAVDALVVAGDIFDSMHPPAEAQELYYPSWLPLASTRHRRTPRELNSALTRLTVFTSVHSGSEVPMRRRGTVSHEHR